MTEQRVLTEDPYSKKDHRFLYGKRYKIIVGSATDTSEWPLYHKQRGKRYVHNGAPNVSRVLHVCLASTFL
jgi:hypothetical protein